MPPVLAIIFAIKTRQVFVSLLFGIWLGWIILSGGNSSRMNSPKAFLSIKGITLIEKLCNAYLNAGIIKPIIQ